MGTAEKKGIADDEAGASPFLYPKAVPGEDPAYLDFIRSKPCLVCGRPGVDPHHQPEEGQGTMAGKCSDYRATPLCSGIDGHHTGNGTKAQPGSYHTMGRELYRRYGVDIEAEIARLNAEYFFV